MNLTRRIVALAMTLVILTVVPGCAKQPATDPNASGPSNQTPTTTPGVTSQVPDLTPTEQQAIAEFLKGFGLFTGDRPIRFKATVPADWQVTRGEFPTGLYWALANEYSKDAGLDLMPLKGHEVEVTQLALTGGLSGQGDQTQFSYPSDVVVLTHDGKIAGAWLVFNKWLVGPSLAKRYLPDITGVAESAWIQQQGLIRDSEANADLSRLDPPGVVRAFFAAIAAGDKTRANACLSDSTMLEALAVNKEPGRLYNQEFTRSNVYSESIVRGKLLSFSYMDPETLAKLTEVGSRTRIEMAAEVELVWRDEAFNTPDNKQTRFIVLDNRGSGWKIEGLGTGP